MGNTRSPFPYDPGTYHSFQLARLRLPAILRYAYRRLNVLCRFCCRSQLRIWANGDSVAPSIICCEARDDGRLVQRVLSDDEAEEDSPTGAVNLFGSAPYLPLSPSSNGRSLYLRRCRSISSSRFPVER
jgi:hypothetical protein